MCFYDLEKVFDSVEYKPHFYPVCSSLESTAIIKCWRLIKSWYTNPTSVVKHNGELSHGFCVCRGVGQRSVLSPILFLVVMDVLLKQLEQVVWGLPPQVLTLVVLPMLTTYVQSVMEWKISSVKRD